MNLHPICRMLHDSVTPKAFMWRSAKIVALALACATPASATLLTNGDFETGDLTGWNLEGGADWAINSATPIGGSHSVTNSAGGGFAQLLNQSFTTGSNPTVNLTMDFIAGDPGAGGASRAMNIYFEGSNTGRINLRLIDNGDVGTGTLQAFDGAWNTLLSGIAFDEVHTLSVDVSDVGGGTNGDAISYVVSIDGNTSSPTQAFQGQFPVDFTRIDLVDHSAVWTADNISVTAVPEPCSVALVAGALGLLALRRRGYTRAC